MVENQLVFLENRNRGQALRWFLLPPLTALGLVLLALLIFAASYQMRHNGRVFTGVSVWSTELSGLDRAEARAALATAMPAARDNAITLVDPATGREWRYSAADLGISYALDETIDAAYGVGRSGGPLEVLGEQFRAWYYGYSLAPIIVFDEGRLQKSMHQLAAEIDEPALDSELQFDGNTLSYTSGNMGRRLDLVDTVNRLSQPLSNFQDAHVELLVHDVRPRVIDAPDTVTRIQAILGSPITFYFREPLQDLDLAQVEVSSTQMAQWLRVKMDEGADGAYYNIFVDEQAVRSWLNEIEAQIYRQPQKARFYFDDDTRELVLVEPHVNGRALDVEATLQRFLSQVESPDRSVPFIVEEITPRIHANVTAAELGIVDLIAESTTWFYGSTPERKHNIARAASQFFGIVVEPGEEFSFIRYLGDITEDAGFTTGLIIIGGQTVEGVGGGVCQVSTTLYQTAFWAGFPITARLEHGYRVHYYDDGEGPGMDATVYDPFVDLKFVNNTESSLLIENYYNETFQSLTFKFYSTPTGRVVEKEGPYFENVTPPRPEKWEYNENLEEGEIRKIDWAVEGADVTVIRRVYGPGGYLMYGDEVFVSRYIPWGDVYQYGPGVDPDNVNPRDIPNE